LKQKGKSKLANILFPRTAVWDSDATMFAGADVRLPAQRREDEQKPSSHFSSG